MAAATRGYSIACLQAATTRWALGHVFNALKNLDAAVLAAALAESALESEREEHMTGMAGPWEHAPLLALWAAGLLLNPHRLSGIFKREAYDALASFGEDTDVEQHHEVEYEET
jgi:hypothetical protein